MPYTASYREEDGIVHVRVWGEATHDEHAAAREEAVRLCTVNHCSRMLVDLRELSTRRVTTLSCFSFGEAMAQESRGLRLAHVLPEEARSREDVRFTSTVEANRGVSSREFDSIDDATAWLLATAEFPERPVERGMS
jgi:hypothetical protein